MRDHALHATEAARCAVARYLFSIELPFPATDIAFGHGLLALTDETEDGAPFVRAFSVTPSLEAMVAQAMTASGRNAR